MFKVKNLKYEVCAGAKTFYFLLLTFYIKLDCSASILTTVSARIVASACVATVGAD